MEATQEQVKGRARIRIADALLRQASVKVEKPKAGEVLWGMMEVKELFDTFQSFLLLPDGYSVVGVFYEPFYLYQTWSVVVESAAILLPPPDEVMPEINPTYSRTEDGKVRLVAINLPERYRAYAGEVK